MAPRTLCCLGKLLLSAPRAPAPASVALPNRGVRCGGRDVPLASGVRDLGSLGRGTGSASAPLRSSGGRAGRRAGGGRWSLRRARGLGVCGAGARGAGAALRRGLCSVRGPSRRPGRGPRRRKSQVVGVRGAAGPELRIPDPGPHHEVRESTLKDWVCTVQLGQGPVDVLWRAEVKADLATGAGPGPAPVAAAPWHRGAQQRGEVPEGGNVGQIVQTRREARNDDVLMPPAAGYGGRAPQTGVRGAGVPSDGPRGARLLGPLEIPHPGALARGRDRRARRAGPLVGW